MKARSETAIEQLEDRMLLSADSLVEFHDVDFSYVPPRLMAPSRSGSFIPTDEVWIDGRRFEGEATAVYLLWSGVSLRDHGGDGSYDVSTVRLDGLGQQEYAGTSITAADATRWGDGSGRAFIADITGYFENTVDHWIPNFKVTGLSGGPGERAVAAAMLVIYDDHNDANNSDIAIRSDEPWADTYDLDGFMWHFQVATAGEDLPTERHDPKENVAPIARDFSASFGYIASLGLPFQVYDANGDRLEFEFTAPIVGQSFLGGGNKDTVFYAPPAMWSGVDSFQYRVFDGELYSAWATVTIEIEGREPPIAFDAEFEGNAGESLFGQLPAQWFKDVTGFYELASAPSVGTVTIDARSGHFAYTSPTGFSGTVTFSYRLWDGVYSNVSTVTLTIAPPVAEPPSAGRPPSKDSKPNVPPAGKFASKGRPAVQPPSPAGPSPFIQYWAFFAPPQDEQGEVDPLADENATPLRYTAVVYSTDQFDARRVVYGSLVLSTVNEGAQLSSRPDARRYEDVDGDGRDDLILVFELDWTALWEGYEQVLLTGKVR